MASSTWNPLASRTDESQTRQEIKRPPSGGVSGGPISCVGRGSPGRSLGSTALAFPSRDAQTRLTAISRAASATAQRRGCFIAGSFGISPPCASGAAGSLSVTHENAQQPCTDGKGPSAQGRGVVSARKEGGAAMKVPIQTAGQRNDDEARTPVRNRQGRFRPTPVSFAIAGAPGPARPALINRKGQPVQDWPPRSGPHGPRVFPTLTNAPTSPPAS